MQETTRRRGVGGAEGEAEPNRYGMLVRVPACAGGGSKRLIRGGARAQRLYSASVTRASSTCSSWREVSRCAGPITRRPSSFVSLVAIWSRRRARFWLLHAY